MIRQDSYEIAGLGDELYDLTLTSSGGWIGVTAYGDGQCVIFNGLSVRLPEKVRFPQVASINEEIAVVVDCRAGQQEKNGWIISVSGEVIATFYAGDAIEQILTTENFVVVTYFDESALTSPGIEGNGVVAFDHVGNYRLGYREVFREDAVDIADCYCICWTEGDRVLFLPYMDFPLVSFDMDARVHKVWRTPENVAGSKAVTSEGDTAYFHAPYNDRAGIYRWRLGESTASRVGGHSGVLTGLSGARFLSVGKNGYTIIHPE